MEGGAAPVGTPVGPRGRGDARGTSKEGGAAPVGGAVLMKGLRGDSNSLVYWQQTGGGLVSSYGGMGFRSSTHVEVHVGLERFLYYYNTSNSSRIVSDS